ncbi:MAG: NAD-dependent epimerase/dehydratase family protein [Patescibacteria group bacterium]
MKATDKKKQKIVITGGLGYIGTELCRLYSGEARYKDIVVLDNRFAAEGVKQLRDWGMDFVHGSILDAKLMESVLEGADLIYHLAGITDVARTKSSANADQEALITETGVTGTQNIINFSPKDAKIVFPSTHVVYEGFEKSKFDISEDVPTKPVLSYSKGKAQSEADFAKSSKDYVIVRLASVYGYTATDTMRINIMPNLFAKIASQNGTISMFSRGVQVKSLVALMDVVRAMKFLGESDISREIFHLSNENVTVKEVAQLCKKINPKVTLVETQDEIPNLGSTISNKKLLATGFTFLYNLETCLTEMIHAWAKKEQPAGLEYVVRGDKEYIDGRGKISNYELTEPINLIGYIESKAGSVRANHYHPIQEQKCLLITGEYVSVIKDLSYPNAPVETRLIKPGDLAVIRPNVAHTMVFLKDSIFLNLVRGEREHANYGITHTIPYVLVDEEFRKEIISNYKAECRACGSKNLKDVITLGLSPLANNLLGSKDEKTELFPLEMKYCADCHNCQLSYTVPAEKLFSHYLYVSSTSKSFREHFEKAADKYIKDFKLTNKDLVVDIGSNDGIALKPLMEKGIRVLGVEPAKNISDLANKNGIETLHDYFNAAVADRILKEKGKASIVTASNVFAHSDFLKDITKNAFKILKDDGQFIVEVQYLFDTLNDLTFDNIYHEHVNYWSVTSIANFFSKLGFTVSKVEHIDTHGGSIRVYATRNGKVDKSVGEFLQKEKSSGLMVHDTYLEFAKKIENLKTAVVQNFIKLKQEFPLIAGYGSPAKATTALNYFGIDNSFIDYIIEDNELKNGKFVPGVNIPIRNKDHAYKNLPQIIIVMAWNFFDVIKANNADLISKGPIFVNIKDLQDPNFQIPKMAPQTKPSSVPSKKTAKKPIKSPLKKIQVSKKKPVPASKKRSRAMAR